MILVDSNIPMYLVGADMSAKATARSLVEQAILDGEALATDAEVLQEILHRYVAIRRSEAIDPAFEALLGIVDVVYPVELDDVNRARRLIRGAVQLSARAAIHVAVMQRREVDRVMSFDRGFDDVPGIARIGP